MTMTEAQWLEAAAPFPMLVFLHGAGSGGAMRLVSEAGSLSDGPSERISPRKVRQFVGACCARLSTLKLDAPSRRTLAIFRQLTRDELTREEARREMSVVEWSPPQEGREELSAVSVINDFRRDDVSSAFDCASSAVWLMAWGSAREKMIEDYAIYEPGELYNWGFEGPPHPVWRSAIAAEECVQAGLLREIVENPFRACPIDPAWLAWRDGTIPRLAERIHQEDAFDLLPILADALEEAECGEEELVAHCRRAGGHVRGCWVVESLRGAK